MLKQLEDYIKKHRKKGFSHSEIGQFLHRHGWHHSHIRTAIAHVRKAETQRFIVGTIWYILLIFIVTIGIVQVGKMTGAATIEDVYCVSDQSGLGQWNLLTSQKTCCSQVRAGQCQKLLQPDLLKDKTGRAIYKADYSCKGPLGLVMINEAGLVRCQ